MPPEKTVSISSIAEFAGVAESTVSRWIQTGKLKAAKPDKIYEISFEENHEFLLTQLKKKRNKPKSAWTPKELDEYSEWHEILDEVNWLIKICYSSKDDIKRKTFRLDRLFVNYLTYHKVTLNKVRQIFVSNAEPNFQRVTDDLKRGWYNELSYSFPLRKSTLGLTFGDISINKPISAIRFAFPSWRITSSYYSIYFYLRAIALQKQDGFRIQEHNATILSFKNNVLQPLMRVLWKFPFDIMYTPKIRVYKRNLLFENLKHTKYNYCNHPRAPHHTVKQIFERVYKTYGKKARVKKKPNSYMLFDYLHDFRIWANYLDIDNLLSLWGPGYKTFIDQNLSMLIFFMGGISEICYLSVFGELRFLEQLQSLYDSFIANSPELENDFINTPVYQRHLIYSRIGITTKTMTLKKQIDLNVIISSPNI
jgi:hypothetical protein